MKKKICKKCKIFVEGETCPICKKNSFSTSWQGRIYFLDTARSTVAKKINVDQKGEYAIKVK
jgi:RNA polymerase subunit RPABC4/transcription elongation factor Spt4